MNTIEIKIQILDKTLRELIASFEQSSCEGMAQNYTISFQSKDVSKWLTEERKKEFEDMLNKNAINHVHKILSVSVVYN